MKSLWELGKNRLYDENFGANTPVRNTPMPARGAMGDAELRAIQDVLAHYRWQNEDPGYQGHYESSYCSLFCNHMGGGYADAVCTGTAALYVAIAALELPTLSEVICSPITDPGTLSAIILNGLTPRLADCAPGSYNMGALQFFERITPQVSAAVVVHATGKPADIDNIMRIADRNGILVIEDCSQAHFATVGGHPVGTFGKIAAFSTMYRKAHITGPCGGVVYTRDLALHQRALAYADRGKPRWIDGYDDRNPEQFLFPALNLHQNELACAIGIASLARVRDTITRRLAFVRALTERMSKARTIFTLPPYSVCDSPFILPVFVAADHPVIEIAEAVRAEGIPLNPHYRYCASRWPWLQEYLAKDCPVPHAEYAVDMSCCLYLNENYGLREAEDIAEALCKVSRSL